MNKKTLLSIAAAAWVLAACGGGGGGDDAPPTATTPPPVTTEPTPTASDMPPDSASQTAEGFTAYLQLLASALSDTTEALDLSKFLPPKSETAEPTPVN